MLVIPKNASLGILSAYDYNGCYALATEDYHLAAIQLELTESQETKLANGITVYSDKEQVAQIEAIILESLHAKIPILSQFAKDPKLDTRTYRHSREAREEIDKVFNKLTVEGKMSRNLKAIPFAFPVFVA
ncbi:hypothetical protein EG328_011589 [Venturia inaequalis]|uniref:Uncharacterized protein n=1 Tax=Venturia inaequalis TaxID=5025 RepID=A0A8H3YJV2_VENIN|nr:hypothetical protein EG328_011589 [Venturia inaequalis]